MSRRFEDLISAAVAIPSTKVRTYVDSVRAKDPDATPEQVLATLHKCYLLAVSTSGGAVGAVAAVPALGTGAALALTSGQVATFLTASGGLALATADVHGIAVDDIPRRRAVLLTALLGPRGPELLEQEIGISTMAWGRTLMTRVPLGTVKAVNRTLRRRAVASSTAKARSIMVGRLLPFGVGAAVGYSGGRLMGKSMIRAVGGAFGPVPEEFMRRIGTDAVASVEATPR